MGGAVQTGQNAISTVFQKMQQYFHKPITTYGYLGPRRLHPQEDTDFFARSYKMIPYEMYRDPATNPFVIPEGGTGNYQATSSSPLWNGQPQMAALANVASFNSFMSQIDHGVRIVRCERPERPADRRELLAAVAVAVEGLHDSRFALNRTNVDAPSIFTATSTTSRSTVATASSRRRTRLPTGRACKSG